MRPALLLICLLPFALGGCLAKTALDVVEAPVKVASKGVDMATTSQSEADEKRGRELRRREAELGKLERDYDKQSKLCVKGDRAACVEARHIYDEIQGVLPTVPVEPEG